jgi:PKD repeat protein
MSAGVGENVHFDGSGSHNPNAGGGPLTYAWSFDDGATATTPTVAHAFASPGMHAIALVVSESTGQTATAIAHVNVINPNQPPSLTGLAESAQRWRVGTKLAVLANARRHRAPIGTVFTFTLNTAASVRISFTRGTGGRHAAAGAIKLDAHQGMDTVRFYGLLTGRRKLRPGSYGATFTATTAAGLNTAPQSLRFTIVR